MTKDKQHLLERFVEMLEQSAGSSGVIVNYDDCASLAEAIQSLLVENERLRIGLKDCAHWVEWCIHNHDAPDSSLEEAALKQARTLLGDS